MSRRPAISCYFVFEGKRLGLPNRALAAMAGNVAINLALGVTPVLGDFADTWFKANVRNLAIIEKHVGRGARLIRKRASVERSRLSRLPVARARLKVRACRATPRPSAAPVGASAGWFSRIANPANFLRVAGTVIPWMAAATALLFAAGLILAARSPADYQQGLTVLIMYLHVPAAWLAMMIYMVMAASALGTLVWRHPVADAAQKAAAPLGAGFTFICLATGSLWGKPMWGTWWVWDARLTSVLILFLIYLGLVAIWQVFEDPGRAAKAAAIFTVTAVVIIPIIHFSVVWWNTLHQAASVFRVGGPTMAASMLWPLLVMAVAFTSLFFTLHTMAIRNEILRRRLRRLSILEAMAAETD